MKDEDLLMALGSVARDERRSESLTLADDARQRRAAAALQAWPVSANAGTTSLKDVPKEAGNAGTNVLSFRRKWQSAGVASGVLAAAASIALWIRISSQDSLTDFSLEVKSSIASERGVPLSDETSTALQVSKKDVPFEVVLRPSKSIEHVSATCVAVGLTRTEPCRVQMDVSSQGAVRLTGQTIDFQPMQEIRVVLSLAAMNWDEASKLLQSDQQAKVVRIQIMKREDRN